MRAARAFATDITPPLGGVEKEACAPQAARRPFSVGGVTTVARARQTLAALALLKEEGE